ncbi:MAG: apolipoprotein N-acyltransferase [Pseudomonadales bacterium]
MIGTTIKLPGLAPDILALIAGMLAPFALSPFNIWPLGLVSLVMLICLVANATVMRGSLRFYWYAIGMYGVGASWIYVSVHEHGNASPLLAGFLVALLVVAWSLLTLLHGFLFMRFVRPLRYGLTLGFACAWYLREWVLTWVLTGFPWLYAGYGFMDTPLSGYIPVIGITGLGFIVVLLAALISRALLLVNRSTALAASFITLAIVGAGWSLTLVKYVEPTGEAISVSVVQGNIDQGVKWKREMVGPIIDTYVGLTTAEWGRDLILWPEAAITVFRGPATTLIDQLDQQGKTARSTLILGIPDLSEEGRFLNTAIAVGGGKGSYIKRRLVPFGEYVPLEDWLRGVIDVFDLPMARNQPGPWEQEPIKVGNLSASLSICYEVIYPEIVRRTVANPDFFITISNDTWFGDSIGPFQHLQMAQARALENGRYLVRGTNNGITAIINESGEIEDRLPQFEQGVLRGNVEMMQGQTLYSSHGNLPMLVLVLTLLGGMLVIRFWHVSPILIR